MSFGFSAGDFVAGANLAYRLIRALSETQGATMEYQEAIQELGCIQQTFLHVGQMRASNLFCQATLNAISYIVHSSKKIMTRFLEKTEKYRQNLTGSGASSLVTSSWRKIGWSLYKKQELVDLKMSLRTRLMAISVLVATANHQNHFKAVQAATKPQTSNSASIKAKKQSSSDSRPTEITAVNFESRNISEEEKTKARDADETQMGNPCSIEGLPSASTEGKDDVLEEIKSSQDEENQLKAAEKDALAAMVKFKLLQLSLKRKGKADNFEEKPKEQPIELKDATGRKYSFPFHMCLTWQGMQDVIRQAFGHAEEMGPQIEAGHYGLVGPNGDTILPQAWDATVKPGLSVSMHVWRTIRIPRKQPSEAITGEASYTALEGIPKETSESILEAVFPRKPRKKRLKRLPKRYSKSSRIKSRKQSLRSFKRKSWNDI